MRAEKFVLKSLPTPGLYVAGITEKTQEEDARSNQHTQEYDAHQKEKVRPHPIGICRLRLNFVWCIDNFEKESRFRLEDISEFQIS